MGDSIFILIGIVAWVGLLLCKHYTEKRRDK